MSDQIFDALQDCMTALEQGAEVEDVLARFPEIETELRPLLEVAELAREVADFSVPSEAYQRSRTRILNHAAHLRENRTTERRFDLPRVAAVVLTAGFVVLISAGGLIGASTQALPGDTLYSMKRAVETVSLTFTSEGEAKRSLQNEYNQRRIDETMALLKLGRSEMVTFEGVVNEMNVEFWVINEIRTQVLPDTNVVGNIEVGMGVEVTGEVQPGDWVQARTITLRTYQLHGTAQVIQKDHWVIDDLRLNLNELTLVDDGIEIGDRVVALLRVDEAGEVVALAILEADDVLGSNGDDLPSETETGESPTREDEVELESTDENERETPEPPQETDEDDDTDTPEPDETDEDDDTPESDETDEPDEDD